jgi:hypothetical protein
VVSFAPQPFYNRGINPWNRIDRRLGEPQYPDAVKKKKPCQESNPGSYVVQAIFE